MYVRKRQYMIDGTFNLIKTFPIPPGPEKAIAIRYFQVESPWLAYETEPDGCIGLINLRLGTHTILNLDSYFRQKKQDPNKIKFRLNKLFSSFLLLDIFDCQHEDYSYTSGYLRIRLPDHQIKYIPHINRQEKWHRRYYQLGKNRNGQFKNWNRSLSKFVLPTRHLIDVTPTARNRSIMHVLENTDGYVCLRLLRRNRHLSYINYQTGMKGQKYVSPRSHIQILDGHGTFALVQTKSLSVYLPNGFHQRLLLPQQVTAIEQRLYSQDIVLIGSVIYFLRLYFHNHNHDNCQTECQLFRMDLSSNSIANTKYFHMTVEGRLQMEQIGSSAILFKYMSTCSKIWFFETNHIETVPLQSTSIYLGKK